MSVLRTKEVFRGEELNRSLTSSTSPGVKCKRIVLSISDKVEVIKMLDHGSSSIVIVTK